MIGLMLFGMFSCSRAVIKEPQTVYVISTKFMAIAKGKKNFNYLSGPDEMAEWINPPKLSKWADLPENIIGFPLEIWLKKIKPVLKDISRKKRDRND
jgi:hypothetical protein